jgi:hypothetical protein
MTPEDVTLSPPASTEGFNYHERKLESHLFYPKYPPCPAEILIDILRQQGYGIGYMGRRTKYKGDGSRKKEVWNGRQRQEG